MLDDVYSEWRNFSSCVYVIMKIFILFFPILLIDIGQTSWIMTFLGVLVKDALTPD